MERGLGNVKDDIESVAVRWWVLQRHNTASMLGDDVEVDVFDPGKLWIGVVEGGDS